MNIEIPCRSCLILPLCINRESVVCKILRKYLVGREEPIKSMVAREYTTLFKCEGITTHQGEADLVVKVHKSIGKAFSPYYFIIEPNGLHVMVRKGSVMKVVNKWLDGK